MFGWFGLFALTWLPFVLLVKPQASNFPVILHIILNQLLLFQVQRLGDSFKELLHEGGGDNDLPMKEMVEKLMMNTIKDDEESLLPHVYPPELEYHLSSIFVEKAPQLVNLARSLPF